MTTPSPPHPRPEKSSAHHGQESGQDLARRTPIGPSSALTIESRKAEPVFLHSSYRTSSTWIWSKLRAVPSVFAYYEYFHCYLNDMTLERINTIKIDTDVNAHPPGAPYFIEFAGLLNKDPSSGIEGYERSMAQERFIPSEGIQRALSPAEIQYVGRLIAYAQSNLKTPVLTCVRTLGRVGSLARAFGGRHILLHRNLVHQWGSYCDIHRHGHPYFIETCDTLLKLHTRDPIFLMVDELFRDRVTDPQSESMFLAFLAMHLYLYGTAVDYCDIVIDVNAVAKNREARAKAEADLADCVGAPVSLADVSQSLRYIPTKTRPTAELFDLLQQLTKAMQSQFHSAHAGEFIQASLTSALEEWDRLQFYAGATQKVLSQRIHALEEDLHLKDRAFAETEAPRSDLQALQDQVHQSQECAETIAHLSEELIQAKVALQRSGEALEAQSRTISEYASTVASLTAELAQANGALDATQKALKEAHLGIEAKIQAGVALEYSIVRLRADLERAESEADQAARAHAEQNAAHEAEKEELRSVAECDRKAHAAALERAAAAAQASLRNLERTLDDATVQLAGFAQTIEAERCFAAEQQEALKTAKAACGALKAERDALLAQLQAARALRSAD
jgi:hypothetical protein